MNDLASTLSADASGITAAARHLRAGHLVALPTETVYGLAADATSPDAVARLYAAKGRPSFNPLIAHVADTHAARRLGLFHAPALALAAAFWPGPLTLVVPVLPHGPVCDLARAGLDSLAVRVPAHPVARAVIAACGVPLAMPSANRSGHVSPTCAAHVLADLGTSIDAVLDAGPCSIGVESTIVDCRMATPHLLRPGGLTRAAIEQVLGRSLVDATSQDGRSASSGPVLPAPGLLASHYAPRARLRLDARTPEAGEAWLGFGPDPVMPDGVPSLNLSPSGNLVEAAAQLFGHLRALDESGVCAIAVARVPMTGLGEAILDRLARAAAPRGA